MLFKLDLFLAKTHFFSPYVNVLAVKKENLNNPDIKKLAKALTSEKAKKFINENYKGAVVPAF